MDLQKTQRVRMCGTDNIENNASSVVAKACLQRRYLAIEVLLMLACLRERVYQAFAWQWVYTLRHKP